MITFFISLAVLLLGYFTYSRFIEKVFRVNSTRQTPAYSMNDGVDYIPFF